MTPKNGQKSKEIEQTNPLTTGLFWCDTSLYHVNFDMENKEHRTKPAISIWQATMGTQIMGKF